MNAERIPTELRARRQWLCWRREQRGGKQTKVPVDSRTGALASSTDPSTWSSFDDAQAAAEHFGCDGVGFVFSETDPFAGIDLDDCIGENHELGRVARRSSRSSPLTRRSRRPVRACTASCAARCRADARKQAVLDGQRVEVYCRAASSA